MIDELLKISQTPTKPLEILQVELEAGIQLIVHTLYLYKTSELVLLPQRKLLSVSDLGYEGQLYNMALVNAAGVWDAFLGNIVRTIRGGGHRFKKGDLFKYVERTTTYGDIVEPLARRDCIVHNLAKVDSDYKKRVSTSLLQNGDSLDINLDYLKDASEALFKIAVEVVKILTEAKLFREEQQKELGAFQRNPTIKKERKIMNRTCRRCKGNMFEWSKPIMFATQVDKAQNGGFTVREPRVGDAILFAKAFICEGCGSIEFESARWPI